MFQTIMFVGRGVVRRLCFGPRSSATCLSSSLYVSFTCGGHMSSPSYRFDGFCVSRGSLSVTARLRPSAATVVYVMSCCFVTPYLVLSCKGATPLLQRTPCSEPRQQRSYCKIWNQGKLTYESVLEIAQMELIYGEEYARGKKDSLLEPSMLLQDLSFRAPSICSY